MAKRIAFLITDSGMDGKDKTTILYASWDEKLRDTIHENSPSKAYQSKSEVIVDEDVARNQAVCKLNGVDCLVLGLPDVHNAVKPKKGLTSVYKST